jgi:AcrR family transcriptional regulator
VCYHERMGEPSPQHDAIPAVKKGSHYHHPDLREAMIRVAEQLLESDGPNGWTVRAAARIAGVSSGAPYRHFADKDTLLAAVAERGFNQLREEIEARLAIADETPVARLSALGEAYVSFAVSSPGRYQIMFGRDIFDRKLHPSLCSAADRTFESLREEMQRAQARGALRNDQPADSIAAAAWAMIHGLADLLLSGRLHDVADGDQQKLVLVLGRTMFEGLLARS